MFQITRQQALKRWDVLSENLREALFSDYNADILWRICEEQHLSEEKIQSVATLAGDVIMGFIHPGDLDDEIKKTLGINAEIAASIARQIDRKIFSLIKSDIDKVYAPPGALAEEKLAKESALPPEISEEHIVDLRKLEEEKRKAEMPQMISLEILKAETEKLKEEKPATTAIKEEIKKEPPITQLPSDAPFILHKQEEMKPVLGAKKSLGGLFGFLRAKEGSKEEAKTSKPVAVEIQIGKKEEINSKAQITEQKESLAQKPFQPRVEPLKLLEPLKPLEPVRVVHYTDLRTPLKADQKSMTNDQRQIKPLILPRVEANEPIDLKKQSAQPPQPIQPKTEIKSNEEMIDLSTMKKI